MNPMTDMTDDGHDAGAILADAVRLREQPAGRAGDAGSVG